MLMVGYCLVTWISIVCAVLDILVEETYGCFSLLILRVYVFHLADFYINVSIPLLIPYQLLSAFRT
jgi:hypothetical protein